MKYDLDLTFGEIFDNDRSALLSQLIDIQHHKAKREESERWAEQLRFIDISDVPLLKDCRNGTHPTHSGVPFSNRPLLVLPLTEQAEDDGSRYIAVSWRWSGGNELPPSGCDVRDSFEYKVQRRDKLPHKSKFPNHFLERAILFAQEKKIDKLWVDKECIYQGPEDDDKDKELGVQGMDAVYGGSDLSVGLLTTGLIHQSEVTLFAELLSGLVFIDPKNIEAPVFKPGIKFLELQTLILRILSDSRWSRGWIFQEDHLASGKMTLLIPHSDDVSTDDLAYHFGRIPGNLQVKVSAFRKAVTMFCLANNESEFRWPNTEILAKAKQYNIWNREEHKTAPYYRNQHNVRLWTETDRLTGGKMNTKVAYSNESIYPSTTSSILADICHRDLLQMEDRVAIMANAARFPIRFDTSPRSTLVKSNDYSLSAILLALVLINGEILNHDMEFSDDGILNHTVRSYLEEKQFKFNPPMLKYQQSWIDHCRFKASTLQINRRGVEVQGFLFTLLPRRWPHPARTKPNPLKLSDSERSNLHRLAQDPDARHIAPSRKFNGFAVEIISLVISKLRTAYGVDCRLAKFLEENLDLDLTPPPEQDAKPGTPYIQDGMAGLVQALLDEREIRLARLEGESFSTPPSAIFVAPLHLEGWQSEYFTKRFGRGTSRSWVFTSWDNGLRSNRVEGYERLASVEVLPNRHEPFGYMDKWNLEQADNMVLRSIAWVNGVWDIQGKRMGKYTFPISGLTEPPRSPVEELRRKRKRYDRDDGEDSG